MWGVKRSQVQLTLSSRSLASLSLNQPNPDPKLALAPRRPAQTSGSDLYPAGEIGAACCTEDPCSETLAHGRNHTEVEMLMRA